ncbi:hypothetical protein HPY27_01605 [Brevibacillus sp. HB1.1]|uniref:DUF7210 family protein n=1 Tax=Brevibacillus sp. HB1.1 TaxID=2738808 RepID=UPI0015771ECB|nr:hypothetical protein [Brevibacillus sp. HB1.1]NTU28856.1 hypothetical protein [Brevibacillus sp. HB1.1]
MSVIVTKGTVRHNGKDYRVGEELPTLKKEEAERLLDLKVVEEKGKSKGKPIPNEETE